MLGNLSACLAVTLHYEGDWSDNPRDPGGATMEGITLAEFRRSHPNATALDLRNISIEDRNAIYQRDYWAAIEADSLPPGLDLAAFDAAVNSGPGQARRWLMQARGRVSTTPDFIRAFSDARLSFLHGLRTFAIFGRGWAARVAGVEALALRMALGSGPVADATVAAATRHHAEAAKRISVGGHTITAGTIATAGAAITHPALVHGLPWPLMAAGVALVIVIIGLIYLRAAHARARATALSGGLS